MIVDIKNKIWNFWKKNFSTFLQGSNLAKEKKFHYYLLLQHCCDSIQQYRLLSFTFVYCCIGKSSSWYPKFRATTRIPPYLWYVCNVSTYLDHVYLGIYRKKSHSSTQLTSTENFIIGTLDILIHFPGGLAITTALDGLSNSKVESRGLIRNILLDFIDSFLSPFGSL